MGIDFDYLKSRIVELRGILQELVRLSSKPYPDLSLDERYSLRYHIVVLAEALGSICLHIAIEDLGLEPKSYAECFKLLESKGIILGADELINIARLRNLLVHRYRVIDDARVYEEIRERLGDIEKILRLVKEKYGL